jgi:hypothetical protein
VTLLSTFFAPKMPETPKKRRIRGFSGGVDSKTRRAATFPKNDEILASSLDSPPKTGGGRGGGEAWEASPPLKGGGGGPGNWGTPPWNRTPIGIPPPKGGDGDERPPKKGVGQSPNLRIPPNNLGSASTSSGKGYFVPLGG